MLPELLRGLNVIPGDVQASPTALLFMALALLITIGTDALRRYVNHRLDMWEARHPAKPEEDADDDE